VITTADEAILRRIVGPATFGRATTYARQGAVRRSAVGVDGKRLVGEVQGGARGPYSVSVEISRTASGRLSGFRSTCTCPVGVNCKHGVALALVGREPIVVRGPKGGLRLVHGGADSDLREQPGHRSRGAGRVAPKKRPLPAPAWEAPLQDLLVADGGADDDDEGEIGLQFELVQPAATPGGASGAGTASIRLRPVTLGRTGNWVRTGISWSRLQYLPWGRVRSPLTQGHLSVLQELLALSQVSSGRPSYARTEDILRLETVGSRRVWDLLREAADRRLPMITAGRRAGPVVVRSSTAALSVDVRRSGTELALRPRITVGDEPVSVGSSMLIGTPAHGIAWWDPTTTTGGSPTDLHLAPFDTPVDDRLRGFLATEAIRVPPRDEERFLHEFYPVLRRKVAVVSSDGSYELPELPPPSLVLFVRHLGGSRTALAWARGPGGSPLRRGLWDGPGGQRDRVAEDALVESVTGVVSSMPELFERTASGRRLAQEAALEGIASARFMTELVPALALVPGVSIEQTGTVPDYREAQAAPVVHIGGSASNTNDWFDLTVTVTVDGEEVPFADLFIALAEGQSHLILPSGSFFSLDRDELRQLATLIAEARSLADSTGDSVRLNRYQVSLWEDLCRLGVVTAQAGAWESSVRSLGEASDRTEHVVPTGLDATLRPYQVTGFNWLVYLYELGLGGILADDMGLGKTLQALAFMCHTRERGLTDAPFLVVAPTSVVGNWASECRRFAPGLSVVAVSETTARRGTTLAALTEGADLVVTSYSLFRLEHDEYDRIAWAGLFLDEAQFAKNRNSQAFQRAKLLPVRFKVAMTGTPIENSLMDLWSLLSITAPGLFASPDRFKEYYQVPIERKADVERLAQLRRRVRPLMLRRTKEEVLRDLPDKQEQILELDLNPKQKKHYQTYLQRERQKVLGLLGDIQKHRFEIFRSLTLLRQASLDMSLVDAKHAKVPSTKLDALMEMIDDIVEDGHRVLVFSQFTQFLTLARLRIEAAGIDSCYLDGSTRKRQDVIAGFRSGSAPVFLISLKAGGFGLNLTEADYCIILDPWWNPATEAQAVDRVHRIGQTKKVMVYRMVSKDTIEEKVMALKARKAALFTNVMDGGVFESGALTASDIRELLD
jgi:superfamily II DNA or RNA helicase